MYLVIRYTRLRELPCLRKFFANVQEIERYNHLLVIMRRSLVDLEKGIQGLVLMSSDLEETFQCIFEGRVPSMWEKVNANGSVVFDECFGSFNSSSAVF